MTQPKFPALFASALRALGIALSIGRVMFSAGAADAVDSPSLSIERLKLSIRVVWSPQASHAYRVESSSALSGAWIGVANLQAGLDAAAQLDWTDTNALQAGVTRFYRVLDQGLVANGALTQEAAFRASDLVPVELGDLYSRSAQNASDAIAFATSVVSPGGTPVTHGTVRLTGDAANPVMYNLQPADRLVLVPLQGPTVDVYVQELDLARGVYQWRQVSGENDLVFRSAPATPGTQISVKGRYVSDSFAGVRFEVDLTGTLTGFSDVDSTGNHQLSDLTVRGSVSTAGYTQTVNARNRFEFISVRGVSGRLQSSSTSENWNNNSVVWGGDTYLWNNVKRQRSFRDGKESDLENYWNASGVITRNGAEFGHYRKTLTAVGTSVIDLRFQVVLADRVVDVERWTVQVPGANP